MIVLFSSRWFYTNWFHLDNGKLCALLSYSIFTIIGLLVVGIQNSIIGMNNQPLIPGILALVVGYLSANLGDLQNKILQIKIN